jgi:hypothetical protein
VQGVGKDEIRMSNVKGMKTKLEKRRVSERAAPNSKPQMANFRIVIPSEVEESLAVSSDTASFVIK